ncbi:MAG: hypothetical protein AB7I27_13315 [Bacteriovoracaceae bacterium]
MKNIRINTLLFSLVMSFGQHALAETPSHYDLNIDQNLHDSQGEEIRRSFKFSMVNDNPFLNLFPSAFYTEDDSGYTHGVGFATSYLLKNGFLGENERWTINLDTDLYTKDMTPPGQNLFPNVPQKFNEISTLKVSRDDVFNKVKTGRPYYVVGAGIGLMNDEKSTGAGAIGQQTAWHDYKHHNLTPETTPLYNNQPGTTHESFLTVKGAVGKVIAFDERMENCQCEVDLIKIEGGGEVVSIRKGSHVYFMIEADKSLLKLKNNSLGVTGRYKVTAHESGDQETQSFIGVRYNRPNLTIESGFNHRQGDYNQDFVKYDDRDSIWNLSVEYRWGKKKK